MATAKRRNKSELEDVQEKVKLQAKVRKLQRELRETRTQLEIKTERLDSMQAEISDLQSTIQELQEGDPTELTEESQPTSDAGKEGEPTT